jgi:hypothetical protein
MRTFRNKNYTKRDYDCTNIVFCQAENKPGANWYECTESEIETRKCEKLWSEMANNTEITYFGYL